MRMSQLLNEVRNFELDEGFSPKEIKMAIGIASDPRYAKGNMTGAVTAIERMKKGLSKHPQVAAVLKRQNENLDEAKFQINYSKGGKLFSKTINAKDEDDAESKAIKQFKIEDDDIRSVVKEAVSPAQQAAIAISKKERGEKPKDEKDEGNAFGAALEKARKNGDKTFVVSGKTYNVEDYNVEEQIDEVKLSPPMIAKIKKTFEPLRGKKIGPTVQDKLMKTMDKIDSDKGTLIDLYKAGIPFVSQLAVARLISKHNMKADQINKLREEVELDEAMKGFKVEFGKGNDAGIAVYKDKKDAEAYAKRAPKPVKITQVTVKNANMFDDPEPTRKEEFSTVEYERYLETKKGSLRDSILKVWGEDAHSDDEDTKKKDLTKSKKDGTKKMTDTGKEITPVDMSPKMPKVKNERNRV